MDGGAGPRHILRHPNNTELLFVLTELSNELIVYKEIAPKVRHFIIGFEADAPTNLPMNPAQKVNSHLLICVLSFIKLNNRLSIAFSPVFAGSILVFGHISPSLSPIHSLKNQISPFLYPITFFDHESRKHF